MTGSNSNTPDQSYNSNSTFQDLNDDLENIYRSYVAEHENGSNETLDSENDAAPPPSIANRHSRLIPQEVLDRFHGQSSGISPPKHNLPVHISSRLSSLKQSNEEIQSAPQTPKSSSSFDFNPNKHPQAMSNASLNILDTPTIEENFKDLVPPKDINSSTSALKSLHIDEDEENQDDNYDKSNSYEENDGIEYADNARNDNHEWNEKGAAVKRIGNESSGYNLVRRSVQDFQFGKDLGEGSYSTVVLATDKISNVKYAVKILDKRHIIKEKKVKYVNIEKHALNRLSNRAGIISLYFTFQDKESLYFVLDYASNGELLSLIKKYNTLNEDCVRYFSAQILDAIKYMHDNGVIHRDIKPENVLLDDKLRVQITDFGTARLLEKKNDDSEDYPLDVRAKSFVGTAEYVSPELLENKYCGKPGDIWAFGCIVYQMIAGKPPFKAANEYLTFQKITKLQFAFSAGFPMIIRDLIKQILVLQPNKRAKIPAIQNHYFFQGINFNDYNQVWNVDPPELGPYKMSAKSMMKVPELTKSPSSQQVNTRRQVSTALDGSKRQANGERRVQSDSVNGRSVNPASVAAFVLNKNDQSPEPQNNDDLISEIETSADEANLTKTASRNSNSNIAGRLPSTVSQAEYIPGTNILRPTIHSIHSYSRSSTAKKRTSSATKSSKPKFKIIEVTPLTPVEVAWSNYMEHPDERVIKMGPVITSRTSTEAFEKKNKGLIHDSPLGFQNRSKQSSSFLSQVVNGNGTSLRKSPYFNAEDWEEDEGNEEDAIHDHFTPEDIGLSQDEPTESSNKLSRTKLLKKIGLSNDKKSGTDQANQHPLDKWKTCTMLITSHGRVLIFFRNDPDANYRLISYIYLNFPFIRFKEVISSNSGSKLLKLPTTGIFAIESTTITYIFEVEKFDVNSWTESLAKAQLNECERQKQAKFENYEKVMNNNNSKEGVKSPKLLESPEFSTSDDKTIDPDKTVTRRKEKPSQTKPLERESKPKSTDHKKQEVKEPSRKPSERRSAEHKFFRLKSPELQRSSSERKRIDHHSSDKNNHGHSSKDGLLSNKLKSKSSVKRKPPPPIPSPTGIDMSTGLGTSNKQDNAMLHAAQLAVSHNTHPSTDNRRSSFTKDTKKVTPINTSTKTPKSPTTSSSSQNQAINSKNSKFLARSQRNR